MKIRRATSSALVAICLPFAAAVSSGCGDGSDEAAIPEPAVDISGTWLGSLGAEPVPLRIVFNLSRDGEGFTGSADSPDQGAFGIPISGVEVAARLVTVRIASIGAKFSGELSKDGQSLDGSFEQGAMSSELRLDKQSGPLVYRRPQDPMPPYPYETKDVQFPSEAPGVTLAGTLCWPRGAGPFPAVVLVSGSGPQNRDEELLNHRPFLVLADALVRRDIAVLRYDDRGVGESTGDFAQATTADFALDARGAVQYLSSQAEFAIGGLGIVGHSEGGQIAPLAADADPSVGFLVLLAGPGVDGKTTLVSQQRAIAAASGVTEAELDEAEAANRTLLACFESDDATTGRLDACLRQNLTENGVTGAELDALVAELDTPWMRYFVTYDPAPVLRRTTVPVLALNGSLDLQVLANLNLPAIQSALEVAGNTQASLHELAGLNHLFQHASTGLPDEYGTIDETLSPEVPALIADFVDLVEARSPSR